MTPPIDRTTAPLFSQLEFTKFQRLCSAMFNELDEVREAVVYGVNGQAQRGIDLLITLKTGKRWVAQVKASHKNERRHLKAAVDDFLPHLPYWRAEGVDSFIVLFGQGIEDAKTHDARRTYEKQFSELGIAFDLWDSRRIRRTLRDMRRVAEEFLDPWWVSEICGAAVDVQTGSDTGFRQAIPSALLAELGDTHDKSLNQIRDKIRSGRESEAESELKALLNSFAWQHLSPSLQARVYRMLGSLALNRGNDVEEAERFLQQARTIDPSGSFAVLETVIRHRRVGAKDALDAMPDPTNRDEWNLRAALLLNEGRADEALLYLQSGKFDPDAETARLVALCYLFRKDIPQARTAAADALSRAPEWILVKETAALVEYFSGIAPGFEGWHHWLWPIPVPWHFVRSDPESRNAFTKAEALFAEIARLKEPASADYSNILAWQLACLANDRSRRAETVDFAKRILASFPASEPTAIWSISRELDIDLQPTREALQKVCESGPRDPGPVQTLFVMLAEQRQYNQAASLLDAHEELYRSSGMRDSWCFQRGQLYATAGELTEANRLLDQAGDQDNREASRAVFARIVALEKGWTEDALAQVDAEMVRSGSDHSLYNSCEAHFAAGKFAYVLKHADALLQRLQTEPALRLVSEAAVADNQYAVCLQYTDQYRSLFSNGTFTPGIARLRARSLRELGHFGEAEQIFTQLAEQERSAADRFELFRLQFAAGKIPEACSTARFLLPDPAVTPEGLLHIAGQLAPEDPQLAKTFLAQASKRGFTTPATAALGMQIAVNLGMREHSENCLAQLAAAAQQPNPPIRILSLDEFFEHSRASLAKRQEIHHKYERGHLTLHQYSININETFANLFHGRTSRNETSEHGPHATWSLDIRYGTRKKPEVLPETSTLFLDISSLFLAAHLETLDLLEQHFAPIRISPFITESLNRQIEALSASDPATIEIAQAVVDLNVLGLVRTLAAAPDSAEVPANIPEAPIAITRSVHQDSIRIWTAMDSNDEVPTGTWAGLGDVFDFLQLRAALSNETIQAAQKKLSNNAFRNFPLASARPNLVIDNDAATLLSDLGLLRPLAAHSQILIEQEFLLTQQSLLATHRQRQHQADWLRFLRERIRNGIDRSIYITETNPQPKPDLHLTPPELRCLYDYLNIQRPSNIVSCCDDRLASRFTHIGSSPTCGLFDVLWSLRVSGKIDASRLFSNINRLRASNARYLPLTREELLHWLSAAPYQDGELIETAELSIIRRYFAACLLDWSLLQVIPGGTQEAHDLSELSFIAEMHHIICDTICALWSSEPLKQHRQAASSWLLTSLWFDLASLPLFAASPVDPDPKLAGLGETQLVFLSCDIPRFDDCREYLDWLFTTMGQETAKLKEVVQVLRHHIVSSVQQQPTPAAHKSAVKQMSRLLSAMPQKLKQLMSFSRPEERLLNFGRIHLVLFNEHEFDEAVFWRAAAAAHPPGNVQTLQSQKNESFDLSRSADYTLHLTPSKGGRSFRLADPALPLLNKDPQQRLLTLSALRTLFDLSCQQAHKLLPRIAKAKRVDLRMREAIDLKARSFAYQLVNFNNKLTKEGVLDLDLARPLGIAPLLQHLRLPSRVETASIDAALNSGGRVLIDEEGFEEAFLRLGSLPLRLPLIVTETFNSLPKQRRREFAAQYSCSDTAPYLALQTASLMFQGDEEEKQQAIDTAVRLCDEATSSQWTLLESLLDWSYACLVADAERNEPTTSLMLSTWLHANRVHQLLAAGTQPEETARFFEERTPLLLTTMFRSFDSYRHDIVSPHHFRYSRILVVALSHYLDGVSLTEEQTTAMKAALTPMAFPYSNTTPNIFLLQQRTSIPNALHSFFGRCNSNGLSTVLDRDLIAGFSDEAITNEIDSLIKSISGDVKNTRNWACLAGYLKMQAADETCRETLGTSLLELSFAAFHTEPFNRLQVCAFFAFGQLAHYPHILPGEWERKLLELSDVLAASPGGYPQEESAYLLANCALFTAYAYTTPAAVAQNFTRLVGSVAERHPNLADFLLDRTLDIMIRQFPSIHLPSWRGLAVIRAVAKRIR